MTIHEVDVADLDEKWSEAGDWEVNLRTQNLPIGSDLNDKKFGVVKNYGAGKVFVKADNGKEQVLDIFHRKQIFFKKNFNIRIEAGINACRGYSRIRAPRLGDEVDF